MAAGYGVCVHILYEHRVISSNSNNFIVHEGKSYCFKSLQSTLKSTGRDRIWTGDYAACGRCHLAHAA